MALEECPNSPNIVLYWILCFWVSLFLFNFFFNYNQYLSDTFLNYFLINFFFYTYRRLKTTASYTLNETKNIATMKRMKLNLRNSLMRNDQAFFKDPLNIFFPKRPDSNENCSLKKKKSVF